VLLRTDAPRWIFPPEVETIPPPGDWTLDIGVVQRDGLTMEIDETRRRWNAFACEFEERAEREAGALRTSGADLVLGDVPPLAFEAAARAGVSGLAVTNFGWDFIYAEWPGFQRAIACIQSAYEKADALLRLPFHNDSAEAFPAFRNVIDVPLVARTSRRPRSDVRATLGLTEEERVALFSFGGFDVSDLDIGELAAWPSYTFLMTAPLTRHPGTPPNVVQVPHDMAQADYASILAASDAVVTKAGYGIVADCLANRVPVLYTNRGPFREYPALVSALHSLGPARFISNGDVQACDLGPHLDALLADPQPWLDIRVDGADVVALRALEAVGWRA
jgi:L-arabinokinase